MAIPIVLHANMAYFLGQNFTFLVYKCTKTIDFLEENEISHHIRTNLGAAMRQVWPLYYLELWPPYQHPNF